MDVLAGSAFSQATEQLNIEEQPATAANLPSLPKKRWPDAFESIPVPAWTINGRKP
jgi:hypothetical protein